MNSIGVVDCCCGVVDCCISLGDIIEIVDSVREKFHIFCHHSNCYCLFHSGLNETDYNNLNVVIIIQIVVVIQSVALFVYRTADCCYCHSYCRCCH